MVGRPPGFAEPENPAPVAADRRRARRHTGPGRRLIVAESVTVELPWLVPTDVIVTPTGYVPPLA